MLQTEVQAEPVNGDTETVLRSAVNHFSDAPLRNGKIMRDLITNNFQEFRAAAVSVMREPADVRGCRYLVTVLWTHDLLIPILGDCSLPKELGRSIAQTAAKVDPQLHIRLIRFLVTGMLEGKELAEASANRLLEILSSIADGPGIHRFIRQMLQHPSPRVRSKVTLLVERGGPGIRALAALIEDPNEDARVRANALESLWSIDSPELPSLFRNCMADPNNRVAGNAILGLYLAGEPLSIRALFTMVASEDPLVQTTAVWTMGRTKDPRFLSSVGHLMLTSKGMLRRTAFKALESIKKAAAERAKNPRFVVNALAVQEAGAGAVQMRVSLTYPASAKPVSVAPTAFVVHMESEPVIDFTCSEQQNSLLCVAYVIPQRAVTDAFRARIDSTLRLCLESKGKAEQWTAAGYQETGGLFPDMQSARLLGHSLDSVRSSLSKAKPLLFSPNSLAIRAFLEATSASRDSGSGALDTIRSAFAAALPSRAVRHVILIVDAGLKLDEEAADQLIADAKAAHFAVSALSVSAIPRLERVCSETSGTFRLIPGADTLESELPLIYASIRSQYVLEFPAPGSVVTGQGGTLPRRLSLSVHAKDSMGECVWESGAESEPAPGSDPPPELGPSAGVL